MKQKAIFLDKDGTLIVNKPYNCDPNCIEIMPGVRKSLQQLQQAGYKLILISNQSGIARGYFTEDDLKPVFERLQALSHASGIHFDGMYYCPHHPDGNVQPFARDCTCRKPLPGLIEQAAREHNVACNQSWMIGDILHDVEAGHRAGCKTIMVDTGYETEWELNALRTPDFRVERFSDIVTIIRESRHSQSTSYSQNVTTL